MSCFKKVLIVRRMAVWVEWAYICISPLVFFPHCGIGSVLPEDGAHPVPVSSRYRAKMAYMFWMDDFAGGYIKKLPIHRG